MAIIRSIPRRVRGASFRGRVMIDSFRGILRVRKWPRKRGRPRSALQRFWVDWFVQANRLAKYADGMSQARAIEMTKDSGLYPRDVLLMAMRGRLYSWSTPDGWRWYSMAAIGDISESLDVLAQTVGNVLVRATDRWRSALGGAVGNVLTHQGPTAPPVWAAPGGGLVQNEIPGSPLVLDGTKSQYDIDVSAYFGLTIIFSAVTLSASQGMQVRCSVDGGLTFKAGATDYQHFWVNAVSEGCGLTSVFQLSDANSASGHQGVMRINELRTPLTSAQSQMGVATTSSIIRAGTTTFTGPVTDIRIKTSAGGNFTGGSMRLFGLRA